MLLAIDFGLKRCGIAVTDAEQIIASPLTMIPSEKLMSWLEQYILQNSLQGIVLGFPLSMNGEPTHITANVLLLKKALESAFTHVPIHLQDERFSSKRAAEAIHLVGKKKQGRDKGTVDKVSAAIILQDYLNEHGHS